MPEVMHRDHIPDTLRTLFEWTVDPCLDFVRKNCKTYASSSPAHQVVSLMKLIFALMRHATEMEDARDNRHLRTWTMAAFFFGTSWSLGGLIDVDGRAKFDRFFRDLMGGKIEEFPVPKELGKIDFIPPDNGTIYDYGYEVGFDWRRAL